MVHRIDRFEALTDAKLLGMIVRNVTALACPNDIPTRTKFANAKQRILRKYGAENVNQAFNAMASVIREQKL